VELQEAYDEATRLLHEHGLDDWRVQFDTAKRRAGVCRYHDRLIGLSAPLTRLHDAGEVRRTILHEIAHALAGPAAGHGPRWQSVARRIGIEPERCLPEDAPRVPGAWVGVCSQGHVVERHRRPERVASCTRCSTAFAPEHLLTWTHHGRPAAMHPNYLAELAAIREGRRVTVLGVGASARVVLPGPYDGRVGTVVKRGRTSYHVRIREGVLRVPFAGVEPG
jgi:predicted SprT family Zn-dependent metalloprotease/ribosomal protein L21E